MTCDAPTAPTERQEVLGNGQSQQISEDGGLHRYFDAVRALIDAVEQRAEAIRQAGRLIADTVEHKGAVFIYDTGHMLSHELIGRAGGLVLLQPVRAELRVEGRAPFRHAEGSEGRLVPQGEASGLAQARAIMAEVDLRSGDLLFVGSVSGRQALPIELALLAKQRGARVVAVTSVAYSGRVPSNHPSGKRLMEVADLVLDHGAPLGDAMLMLPGAGAPVVPASGMGAAVLMWGVIVAATEELIRRGLSPGIYRSINLDGSLEHNRRAVQQYEQRGY